MRGHRGAVRRGALPAGLLLAGLTAGCTGSSDSADDPAEPTSTPVSEIDLTGLEPSRTDFCDELDPAGVASVLGGEPDSSDSYASGQRAELVPGLEDVAHEYSCTFERESGTARAWLFAQPVTEGQARAWVAERKRDEGCRPAGDLVFGDPGLVQACGTGPRQRVVAVGLFADSWLTCQVTVAATGPEAVDPAELLEQTQRWCATVAETTS